MRHWRPELNHPHVDMPQLINHRIQRDTGIAQ